MIRGESDWRQRYDAGDTPWDLGEAHPELRARLAAGWSPRDPLRRRALVPGCGRGHDALALARAGWRVTAIDWVDPTGGKLADELAKAGGEFHAADALETAGQGRFDLVFDHTFFCAIEPDSRPRWGQAMARLLAQDGELVALVFPFGKPATDGGPPFGMGAGQMLEALGRDFRLRVDEAVTQRVARRSFSERWAVLERVR